jgi:hypothetical protein
MAFVRFHLVTVLLAYALVVVASAAKANDIFIGTLSVEDDGVVLKRCDAAQNAYLLRDADGIDAVDAMRKRPPAPKGYWYGEVVGEYIEIDGRDGLLVTAIESIEADRSCHLLDALGGIEEPSVDHHAEPANSVVPAARTSNDD